MDSEEKAEKLMALLTEYTQIDEKDDKAKAAIMRKLRQACETKYGLVND